jgi:hypothetical protein
MYDVGEKYTDLNPDPLSTTSRQPSARTHPRTAILFIPVGTPLVFLLKATVDRKIKHLVFVFFKQLVCYIISNKTWRFLNFT